MCFRCECLLSDGQSRAVLTCMPARSRWSGCRRSKASERPRRSFGANVLVHGHGKLPNDCPESRADRGAREFWPSPAGGPQTIARTGLAGFCALIHDQRAASWAASPTSPCLDPQAGPAASRRPAQSVTGTQRPRQLCRWGLSSSKSAQVRRADLIRPLRRPAASSQVVLLTAPAAPSWVT
jgi:hypothetical protein